MTDEKANIPAFDLDIKLPKLLTEPIQLKDGTVLAIGDRVEHLTHGIGTIKRIGLYDDEPAGPVIYVGFQNGISKILAPEFVRKVTEHDKQTLKTMPDR